MKFPGKKVMPRYFLITVVLGVVGLLVLFKAAHIMFLERDYWEAVSDRFVKDSVEIYPERGNIYSADGQLLAGSLPEYKIYMDFMSWEKDSLRRIRDQHRRDSLLNAKMDSICDGMHRLFPDIDPQKFRSLLREGRAAKSHHWLLYPKRISYIEYQEVKRLPYFSLPSYRGGFHAEEFKQRKKPFGSLAARTIGEMYGGKDTARFGLELSLDTLLRGKPGLTHRQKVRRRYLNIIDVPAQDGYDVVTTLDVGMQDICEQALNDKLTELEAISGICILMEVPTGDIKAMTSLTRCADGKYREVRNAAVSDLPEPGSVFKPVSFMVAMDDGYIDMDTRVNTGSGIMEMHGRRMRDHNWHRGGYGEITVPKILQVSSNIGVSYLIDKFYYDQPGKYVDGVYRTGITEDTKLPIPGYARPRLRRPKEDGSNWSKTALAWMSIGYESQIPPINTLMFYNGIANGGRMVRPRLVKSLMRNGEVVREYPVEVVREQMCKPTTLKNLQTILEQVVSIGLGKAAGNKLFHVSGKTGTAQVWTSAGFASEYFVSFAGYFPSENPQYSCIVCIRKRGVASGGGQCGPVFRKVSEAIMAQRLRPDLTAARDTVHAPEPEVKDGDIAAAVRVMRTLGVKYEAPEAVAGEAAWGEAAAHGGKVYIATMPQDTGRVPDVVGMGARDAVFCLEQAGLRVKLNGVGAVTRQSIKAGSPLVAGQVVELELKANRKARKAEPRPAPPAPVDTVAPPSTGQKARSDSAAPKTPVKKQSGTPAKQNDRQQACLFEGRQRHVPAKPIRNA